MAIRKKIVLLIVEGEADEAALAPLIKEIVRKEDILVKLCEGDLTSKIYTSREQNVVSEIGRKVNEFITFNKIKKADIVQVVHIIDTDGAYIKDECIFEANCSGFIYSEEGITAPSKESVIRRNLNKTRAMDNLVARNNIMDIPYRVFYMSCNLDHVLYNERNLEDKRKVDMADDFADQYLEDIDGFVSFMNDRNLIFEGEFRETWRQIKLEKSSLMRHSNLHIFINEYVE